MNVFLTALFGIACLNKNMDVGAEIVAKTDWLNQNN